MALDPLLLEILACPEDKGPLLYFEDEETLYNPRLRRRYRILDGIPVLLVEEAETVTEEEHGRLEEKAAADAVKFELRPGRCVRPPAALRIVGHRQRGIAASVITGPAATARPDLPPHDVADLALAPQGRHHVEWASLRMPVLAAVRARFSAERPLEGVRVGACLHVTAETANLLRTLTAGGADVAVCASNPLSTNDDVAAALVTVDGVATFARRAETPAIYASHLDAVLDHRPALTIDDGCDLVARLHLERPRQAEEVLGGTEDTTTGALRLRAIAASGSLRYPVVAVSGAETRRLADNRYGTGQSTMDGIMRATNVLVAGTTVVVAGYGNCGRGIAERARGLGAIVIVTETDPCGRSRPCSMATGSCRWRTPCGRAGSS